MTARPAISDGPSGRLAAAGKPFAPFLERLGLPRGSVRADLGIVGRTPSRHTAEQAAMALLGFLAPPALAGLAAAAQTNVDWQIPLWASLILAGLGIFAPDLALASEAQKRRTELRQALSGMLRYVPDVRMPGRVGEHLEGVKLRLRGVFGDFERLRRGPVGLPFFVES